MLILIISNLTHFLFVFGLIWSEARCDLARGEGRAERSEGGPGLGRQQEARSGAVKPVRVGRSAQRLLARFRRRQRVKEAASYLVQKIVGELSAGKRKPRCLHSTVREELVSR